MHHLRDNRIENSKLVHLNEVDEAPTMLNPITMKNWNSISI